jgi:Mg-chelatase subunit ChlD
MQTNNRKKLLILGAVLLLYGLVLTPILIINLQKQQELRGRAATPAPVCANVPVDVTLIIDKSGSMNDQVGSSGTKLANAKTAAKAFVDIMAQNTNNRVGLITYANTGTVNLALTNNFSSVKTQIDAITATGNTCTQCGVNKSNQEITSHGRAGIKKVTVLLTDGLANYIEGGSGQVSSANAEAATLTSVRSGNTASGTVFFTIGLGSTINTTFLNTIANDTGGTYYASPTTDQLNTIYAQISQILGKGSIAGTVFNDANNNAALDTNDPRLANRTLQLFAGTSTTAQTYTSDAQGNFTIQGLCDGTYTLKQVLQTGWTQTLPTSAQGYTITITSGNAVLNRDFGSVLVPTPTPTFTPTPTPTKTPTPTPTRTPTPTPTSTPTPTPTALTTLSVKLLLDGLGHRGDNANPDEFDLSNQDPKHPTKATDIQVFNVNNQLVTTATGTVVYNQTNGNFTGTFPLSVSLPQGSYTVKVRTQKYLRKLIPGIQTLGPGTISLAQTALVAGDINFDNALSILDYNILLDCFSDLLPAPACESQTKKDDSDITDDSFVNQFDYNLFLRELSTQVGE